MRTYELVIVADPRLTDDEMVTLLQLLSEAKKTGDERTLVEDVFWSVLSSREFLFNH